MSPGTSGTTRPGRRLSPMLTEERIQRICELVIGGVPQQAAASSLGIPPRTFQNWLANGRAENAEGLYLTLALELDQALGQFHASRARIVYRGSENDPRLALEILQRRFKDDWADWKRSGDVNVNVNLVASPEWQELETRLLSALQAHPEALADVLQALAGAEVVDGEVVEVREIEAA